MTTFHLVRHAAHGHLDRVLTGRIRDEDLVMIQESEEAGQLEEVLKAVAGADAAHAASEAVSSHPHTTRPVAPPPKR